MQPVFSRMVLWAALVAVSGAAAQEIRKVSDEWTLDAVSYNARLVADWMSSNPIRKRKPTDWTYGAFYAGITALGLSDPSLPYLEQAREVGRKSEWTPLTRTYHADDHCIGQSWAELAALDNNWAYLENLLKTYDTIIAAPCTNALDFVATDSQKRWSWCDALFMSPTVLVRLGGLTGNTNYLAFMDREYKATYDLLYSKEDRFFFRDSRYFNMKTKNGKNIYWCRGNGWVFGSLPIILRDLPSDWPTRSFYLELFKEMAAALKQAQSADGAWPLNLCDPDDTKLSETSGTCFFTYGLLWGINNGVLDRAEYQPCVENAWVAITKNINDQGRLGWVQPVGDRPMSAYTANDYDVFAVGAYLLAAMELRKLIVANASPSRKIIEVTNPVNVFRPAETVSLKWVELGLSSENLRVFDVRNSAVVPHQLVDTDDDRKPDELLFTTSALGKQTRTYWLVNSAKLPAADTADICFSRFAPERKEDFLWENDRTAHRVHSPSSLKTPSPEDGPTSSGIDVWSKRVRYPVINKWLKRKDRKKDEGEGLHSYSVQQGRGCGGFSVFRGTTNYVSHMWEKTQHLFNGPVRTAFDLTYAPWDCGDGVHVSEARRTTLDAGAHLTRFESRFSVTNAVSIQGGPGLDVSRERRHKGTVTANPAQGWLTNFELDQGNGSIATALVLPQGGVLATDTLDNIYLRCDDIKPHTPLVWYAGASWSSAGSFVKAEYWNTYVSNFAHSVKAPLSVVVKPSL